MVPGDSAGIPKKPGAGGTLPSSTGKTASCPWAPEPARGKDNSFALGSGLPQHQLLKTGQSVFGTRCPLTSQSESGSLVTLFLHLGTMFASQTLQEIPEEVGS